MKYTVTGALSVKARSSIHDTTTRWDNITGEVTADPDAPDGLGAATGQFSVDMTSFDAGDWLKNRKLRKDFDMDTHPTATFSLEAVSLSKRDNRSAFEATARGTLRWRGKILAIELAGKGTLDRDRLAAEATFELDIKRLGLAAPKFFLFKVEDVVTVDVKLIGVAS